jgi:protein-S-isoprenylcysteine O-methyltransferase Ste14
MALLFAVFLLFFSLALVLPSIRVWRQTGINPIALPKGDDLAGFVGNAFKLLITLLGTYLALGTTGLVQSIGPIPLPIGASHVGWGLITISVFWVIAAQFQMGRSWRVGVDANTKTDLIVHGLFRFSRNPIFLGMMAQLAGLFLVLPDAVTLTTLLAGYLLMSVQIRQEEQHLAKLHATYYRAYRDTVRRWL